MEVLLKLDGIGPILGEASRGDAVSRFGRGAIWIVLVLGVLAEAKKVMHR